MYSKDEFSVIREELAGHIAMEKARLKSFGTKPKPFDYANAIAEHMRAERTKARHQEIAGVIEFITAKFKKPKKSVRIVLRWLEDREKGLGNMAKALKNSAIKKDEARPRKSLYHSAASTTTKSSSSKEKKKSKKKRR